jgi:hypothetical protein
MFSMSSTMSRNCGWIGSQTGLLHAQVLGDDMTAPDDSLETLGVIVLSLAGAIIIILITAIALVLA